MNGAMFNSLARFVDKNYPEVSFSDLCQKASLRTNIFAELTWYSDKDFFNLMGILSNQTQKEVTTLWREFGKETFAYFAEIFSDYMKNVNSLDEMLTRINKIHHEISKDGLGTPPRFEFKKVSGNHFAQTGRRLLEIRYTSNRNLNDFFLGMLEKAAKYFDTSVKIIGRKERGKLVASITIEQPEMMPASW
jgi:hypothetical protein